MNKLAKVLSYFTSISFGLAIGYLTLTRLFEYCTIDAREVTHYEADNWIINILIVLVMLLMTILIRKYFKPNSIMNKLEKYGLTSERLLRIWFYAIFAFAAWFVVSTQMRPKMDQFSVFQIASELRSRDYTQWKAGGYMATYPNQNGYVLFIFMLSKIFGDYNNVGLQLVNVIAWIIVIASCRYLVDKHKNLVMVLGSLFFPLMSYVTYVYGTMVGMACAMIAFCLEKKYFKTNKGIYMVLASLFISAASILKNNYLIFMIALVIVLVIHGLKEKKWSAFAYAILIGVVWFMSSFALNFIVEKKLNADMDHAMPTKAWIVMGMQEGNRASGWYNAYNDTTLLRHNYNIERVENQCREDLKEQVKYFIDNPDVARAFYHRKIVSLWNNPDFECFWTQCARETTVFSSSLTAFFRDGENPIFKWILKTFHWLTLTGTLMSVVICLKKHNIYDLTGAIIFMGGFLFHIMWEGKCQYTVVYFIFLIPYAIEGYNEMANILERIFHRQLIRNKAKHD